MTFFEESHIMLLAGDTVTFTGCNELQQSYGGHGYADHSQLTEGKTYILDFVEIHDWHTKVWVMESLASSNILGPFNSVCFEGLTDASEFYERDADLVIVDDEPYPYLDSPAD